MRMPGDLNSGPHACLGKHFSLPSCKLLLIAKGRGEEERMCYQVRFEKGWKVNEVERSRQALPNGRLWQTDQEGLAEGDGHGPGEMRSSREQAFSTQTIINSESYHRVEERALKEKAKGVMRPDTDRWESAEGSAQKIWACHKRSHCSANIDTALNGWFSFPWIKRLCS